MKRQNQAQRDRKRRRRRQQQKFKSTSLDFLPMKYRKMLNSRSSSTTASHHQNNHNVTQQQLFGCSEKEQQQTSNQRRVKTSLKAPTHHQHEHESLNSESDISSVLRLQLRNRLNRNRNYAHVRRKIRWNFNMNITTTSSTTMLLVMLMCIVVRMELVIGALSLNYNSVNYYDNLTTKATFSDESNLLPFLDEDDITLANRSTSRPPIIYHNEFALYIPSGLSKANDIAEKYGFINMGQVSVMLNVLSAELSQNLYYANDQTGLCWMLNDSHDNTRVKCA